MSTIELNDVVVNDTSENTPNKQSFEDETEKPLLSKNNTENMMKGNKSFGNESQKRITSSSTEALETGKVTPDNDEPKDNYNLLVIFFILHGIGTLMPWNAFINADSYFTDYKLMIHLENGTTIPSPHRQFWAANLGTFANLPGFLFNLINVFVQFGGNNLGYRIVPALIVEVLVVVFTIAMAVRDTTEWISGFFYLTLVSVVILNIANAIYQNSVFGLGSKFPMKYIGYVILGNNICGTFTSVVNIATLALAPGPKAAAVYYFSSALVILLVAIGSFFVLSFNKFYRYHSLGERSDCSSISKKNNEVDKEVEVITRPPYLLIIQQGWKQFLNVFMIFFVTLACFPLIQLNIRSSDSTLFGDADTTNKYFAAVFCFLGFNVSAMIGNLIPNWFKKPGPDHLYLPIVARFLFIPFFLACNLIPQAPGLRTTSFPIFFDSNLVYILGQIVFGMSSGYLSSLAMMYAPGTVEPRYAGTAGMMAATCLLGGIIAGIRFSGFILGLMIV